MTTTEARAIAQQVSDNIFGAGASETIRLGNLAVQVIRSLADQLDGLEPPDVAPAAAEAPAKPHGKKKH